MLSGRRKRKPLLKFCFLNRRPLLRMTSVRAGMLSPIFQIPSLWADRSTSHKDRRSVFDKLGATSVVLAMKCGTQPTDIRMVHTMQPIAIFPRKDWWCQAVFSSTYRQARDQLLRWWKV